MNALLFRNNPYRRVMILAHALYLASLTSLGSSSTAFAQAYGVPVTVVQPYFECFANRTWTKRKSSSRDLKMYKTAADEKESDRWISANDPSLGPIFFQISSCSASRAGKKEVLVKRSGTWDGASVRVVNCSRVPVMPPQSETGAGTSSQQTPTWRPKNSAIFTPVPSQVAAIVCE